MAKKAALIMESEEVKNQSTPNESMRSSEINSLLDNQSSLMYSEDMEMAL